MLRIKEVIPIPRQRGYQVVLKQLGVEEGHLSVTKHGPGDPQYSLKDCRDIARRFMGKGPWTHRRPDLWTIDHIVLTIRPFYIDDED